MQAYVASERAAIGKKYRAELKKLSEEHEAKCKSNQRTASAKRAECKKLETELDEAGLFAFGKKERLRAEIESHQKAIQSLATEKAQLDASYQSEKKKKEGEQKAEIAKLPNAEKERFSMPKEPQMSKRQLTNEELKDAIITRMEAYRRYTVDDMIREIPELVATNASNAKVSALINSMCKDDDGRLMKTTENRISYFTLA